MLVALQGAVSQGILWGIMVIITITTLPRGRSIMYM